MERQSVLTVNCPRCGHPTEGRIGFDNIECVSCGTAVGVWDEEAGYYRFLVSSGSPMISEEMQDDG